MDEQKTTEEQEVIEEATDGHLKGARRDEVRRVNRDAVQRAKDILPLRGLVVAHRGVRVTVSPKLVAVPEPDEGHAAGSPYTTRHPRYTIEYDFADFGLKVDAQVLRTGDILLAFSDSTGEIDFARVNLVDIARTFARSLSIARAIQAERVDTVATAKDADLYYEERTDAIYELHRNLRRSRAEAAASKETPPETGELKLKPARPTKSAGQSHQLDQIRDWIEMGYPCIWNWGGVWTPIRPPENVKIGDMPDGWEAIKKGTPETHKHVIVRTKGVKPLVEKGFLEWGDAGELVNAVLAPAPSLDKVTAEPEEAKKAEEPPPAQPKKGGNGKRRRRLSVAPERKIQEE